MRIRFGPAGAAMGDVLIDGNGQMLGVVRIARSIE